VQNDEWAGRCLHNLTESVMSLTEYDWAYYTGSTDISYVIFKSSPIFPSLQEPLMRSIRFLAVLLALGFAAACSDLGPTAVQDGCDRNTQVDCDGDDGYIGSDT
jgi:hypothetical protein